MKAKIVLVGLIMVASLLVIGLWGQGGAGASGVPKQVGPVRPDFSGAWSGSGKLLTIQQNATTLAVTEGTQKRTYNLDGSESRFEGAATNQYRSQMTARTRWVGSALVIETTTVSSIGTWQDLEVYSVDYGPKLSVVQIGTQTTHPLMYTTVATFTKVGR
jgi:hypothetical protein